MTLSIPDLPCLNCTTQVNHAFHDSGHPNPTWVPDPADAAPPKADEGAVAFDPVRVQAILDAEEHKRWAKAEEEAWQRAIETGEWT